MAALLECMHALRARAASGLAASTPWDAARSVASSAAAARFRREPELTVRYEDAPVGEPKPDLVDKVCPPVAGRAKAHQFMGDVLLSAKERLKVNMRNAAAPFERFEGDTGSTEVQVARITQKILALAKHMRTNRKDFSARRGLEAMLTQRRALLQYMRRHDFDTYAITLSRLDLKDNFAKQDRNVRFPTGRGTP